MKTKIKMPTRVSIKGYTFDGKMWLSKKNADLAVLEYNLIMKKIYEK